MSKYKIHLITAILVLILVGLANTALAGPITSGVSSFGQQVYGSEPKSPLQIAALIISVLLTLLGMVFFGLVLYGGFLYMTSSGKEDKIKKAKDTIIAATIGLIIVLTSYAISVFIINTIISASEAPGTSPTTPPAAGTPEGGS